MIDLVLSVHSRIPIARGKITRRSAYYIVTDRFKVIVLSDTTIKMIVAVFIFKITRIPVKIVRKLMTVCYLP